METLNINCDLPDFDAQLEQLKKNIISKLTEGYGYELQDETLPLWIIMIAVRNNKPKSEVEQDLIEFISDNSADFTNWLWQEIPKIWVKPEPKRPVKQETKKEVTPKDQPKVKSSVAQKNVKQKENSQNLMKKAIGDAFKSVKQDHDPPKAESANSKSFVTTNKQGRKIISLKKPKDSEIQVEDAQMNEHNTDSKQQSNTDVFKRLKTKGKDNDKVSSNLDISLDSVIKKQKQKEFEEGTKEWNYGGGRKRNHYEVTEENIYSEPRKRPKRTEEPEAEDDVYTNKKRQYPAEIGTDNKTSEPRKTFRPKGAPQEEGEGEGAQEASSGYKGKKKNPYFNMMGYMPPAMYGYPPMYQMDPYMMNPYYGYKPKKFKNKTLIVKKDDKDKANPTTGGIKSDSSITPPNPADKSNAAPSSMN